MSKNEAVMRRIINEVWNQKKPALIDEFYDKSFVMETPDGEFHGLAGYRELYTNYVTAFPDCRLRITDLFGGDDKLAVAYTFTGTHSGSLMGVPPSHKRVSVEGTAIVHFRQGKIVRERTIWDTLGLMKQIGAAAIEGEMVS